MQTDPSVNVMSTQAGKTWGGRLYQPTSHIGAHKSVRQAGKDEAQSTCLPWGS
jgi:hypothetical protein